MIKELINMVVFLPGIYLVSLTLGIFLVIMLIKNGNRPNMLLSFLIGSFIISMWNSSIINLDIPEYLKFRIIDINFFASSFFWGPLLFLYVKSMTKQVAVKNLEYLPHLIFPISLIILQFAGERYSGSKYFPPSLIIVFFIYTGLYLFQSIRSVQQHQNHIQQNYSQIDLLKLDWLKQFLIIFMFFLVIDSTLATLMIYHIIQRNPAIDMIVLLESCTIFLIGYFSIKQSDVLFKITIRKKVSKAKYDNSALGKTLSKELANNLKVLMSEDQPYKKNDLKLSDLAELMNLSNHHLSQIINEQFECNFYEYINKYRIDEAVLILQQRLQTNITRLAFEVGFNNRVSFTNAFKKRTGYTPSAYIKSHNLKL